MLRGGRGRLGHRHRWWRRLHPSHLGRRLGGGCWLDCRGLGSRHRLGAPRGLRRWLRLVQWACLCRRRLGRLDRRHSLLHGGCRLLCRCRLGQLRAGRCRATRSRGVRRWCTTTLRRGSSRWLHIKHLLTFTLHGPLCGRRGQRFSPGLRSLLGSTPWKWRRQSRPASADAPAHNIASRWRYVIGDGQCCQRKSCLIQPQFQLSFRVCRVPGRTAWPCPACPSNRRRPRVAHPCG